MWRVKFTLAKIRKAARELLTLDEKDPKRLFEGNKKLELVIITAMADDLIIKGQTLLWCHEFLVNEASIAIKIRMSCVLCVCTLMAPVWISR